MKDYARLFWIIVAGLSVLAFIGGNPLVAFTGLVSLYITHGVWFEEEEETDEDVKSLSEEL